jgi:hypothetical protein
MTRAARLERLEADLHATVQRLSAEVAATIRGEASIPERQAFATVAERWLVLRSTGRATLPADADVVQDGNVVRVASGAVLCSAAEWPLYLTVARRVVELWEERDGPAIGLVAP